MRTTTVLIGGIDMFTSFELLQKVAGYKGLKLDTIHPKVYSKPIKVYGLDEKLLAMLAERGIKRQARPDRDEVFTLVDENPQPAKEFGWAHDNYWNFKLLEGVERRYDLHISLDVSLAINLEKRGVVLWPEAHSSFLSPVSRLPKFRLFKALVENDDDAPAVAKELAASDGAIVATWTELGLGGIRRLVDLFSEFACGNQKVLQLGGDREVFNPTPFPHSQQPGEEIFVAEPAQPRIIQTWRAQLSEYRDSLVA